LTVVVVTQLQMLVKTLRCVQDLLIFGDFGCMGFEFRTLCLLGRCFINFLVKEVKYRRTYVCIIDVLVFKKKSS
jgi:hypothetical protein